MTKTLTALCTTISFILFLLMLGMVVIMNSLVFTRYLLSYSPSWTEEITRYAMVWMVMLGAAVLVLFEDHITLYLFNEKFSPRVRFIINNCIRLLIAVASAIVAWTGYKFAFSLSAILAPGSQLSMTIPTIAVPLAATLMTFFSSLLIYNDFRRASGRKVVALPRQKQFMDGSFRPPEDEEEENS